MNATALTANRPTAADARVLADVVAAPFEKLRVPSWARHAALVVLGSWLVAGLAQLVIPMGLVPITGQTLGVLLVGALLGSRRGSGGVPVRVRRAPGVRASSMERRRASVARARPLA